MKYIQLTFISIFFIFNTGCDSQENKKYQRELAQNNITFDENEFFDYIIKGEIDTVDLFIKAGMDIESTHRALREPFESNESVTPLITASYLGLFELVKYLVENGADVNYKSYRKSGCAGHRKGTSALMAASAGGHYETALFLINEGADINYKRGNNHMTSLMMASKYGNTEIVKLLLVKGADVNIKRIKGNYSEYDDFGKTAIIYAVENNYPEIAKLLIQNVAKINETTETGETPFIFATRTGNVELMKLLIDKGADINLKGKDGKTALMNAMTMEDNKILLKFLIEIGADPRIKDDAGKSPLDEALEDNDPEIINIMNNQYLNNQ